MSTQQDIYVAGFKNRPPMLNKENYVSWSSRLLHYAKSRPNGKLIYNSIINGPYVRRMIPEPGDQNREVPTILLGLRKDIYAAVDSCETALEIWLRVQQIMKGSDSGIQEKKAKLFNEWERFTSTDGESIESYYHHFSKLMNDFKRNKHFPEKIASNLKFLNNLQPEWSRHVTIVHQTKDLHTAHYTQLYDFLKYNQKEVDDLRAERLLKIHDPLALMANSNNPFNYPMVGGNGGNQFRQYAGQNVGNQNRYNSVQNVRNQVVHNVVKNPSVQTVGNQNGLSVVPGIANKNLNGNDNVVAAPAEGNAIRNNADLDEIEEVNENCVLMANFQQASTSGTQTDKAPVYDSDGSAEVHHYDNCYNNDIFNMFTQEEQYTELLEPIRKPHQVQQNDNNVIFEVSSMEQDGGTADQHPATVEETRAYFESIYNNLVTEVEKVNTINRKLKETNVDLTTELARYKKQEKCSDISQEKYDKLERCYQNFEKSTVSSLLEEKKKLKSDFKIREDELLDKQIHLENTIKELDNILVKMGDQC
ncbi:hypothetical protein Tco_1106043 [Tanacetum coccineum]